MSMRFASFVQRDTRFAEARYLVGLDALRMGLRTDAIANVQAALVILPEWPKARSRSEDAFMAVERFEDAIEAFDAALGLASDAPARLGRVQALSYLERHDAAIAQADEMLARWNLVHRGRPLLEGLESRAAGFDWTRRPLRLRPPSR